MSMIVCESFSICVGATCGVYTSIINRKLGVDARHYFYDYRATDKVKLYDEVFTFGKSALFSAVFSYILYTFRCDKDYMEIY